ncbi:hypothetical protein K7X08_003243 [Anisodus acutangulus]|uniref:holo-[acyl-carrier-protein] synthase n=1 Tax=Anisodus acutangulus TaxID=402998 RepID=A0A9Q1MDP2_9SOLA|nr:hypothetical protein K7X08_003243 [Anisodus acutangulus]
MYWSSAASNSSSLPSGPISFTLYAAIAETLNEDEHFKPNALEILFTELNEHRGLENEVQKEKKTYIGGKLGSLKCKIENGLLCTAEGKPYLECDKPNLELPNFNFSASHHGDFVAIASEPICLVGLDVVAQTIPEKESVEELIQSFSSYFSRLEWFNIINAGSSRQILSINC